MVREALEVVEFVPRQPVEAARVDYPDSTGHIWSRLRLERRTLRSCCAALASTSANFAPVRNHTSLERNGERLLLGTAEMRVFSRRGGLYAAPTLIYHYVKEHGYKPPNELIEGTVDGAAPPSAEYFDQLARLGLKWRNTSAPQGSRLRLT